MSYRQFSSDDERAWALTSKKTWSEYLTYALFTSFILGLVSVAIAIFFGSYSVHVAEGNSDTAVSEQCLPE